MHTRGTKQWTYQEFNACEILIPLLECRHPESGGEAREGHLGEDAAALGVHLLQTCQNMVAAEVWHGIAYVSVEGANHIVMLGQQSGCREQHTPSWYVVLFSEVDPDLPDIWICVGVVYINQPICFVTLEIGEGTSPITTDFPSARY